MQSHLALSISLVIAASSTQQLSPGQSCGGSFFATFNIQNFGVSKASRSAVLNALAKIVERYDIVAIQELSQMPDGTDACGQHTMSAICDLLSTTNSIGSRAFSLAVSPRIGDEQYALIFNSANVVYQGGATYPDTNNVHSRPPYAFQVTVGGSSLVMALTHTTPSSATAEIENFPSVMTWMESTFVSDYRMIVGDFNADGSYFNEDTSWSTIMAQMLQYSLLTGNELDTTVASSSNTYDRIIASKGLPTQSPAVFVIENHIDLSSVRQQGCTDGYVPSGLCGNSVINWADITKELSDHYPVEMCLLLSTDGTVTTTTTTGLLPGDCAVVGVNSVNPDDFGIVLLKEIGAGQKLFATDDGVLADGSLRRNEGIISFTAGGSVSAGTVLKQSDFSGVEEGTMSLASSGDQLTIFVGAPASPEYICAANFDGTLGSWQTTADSSSTSALPTGLTNGVSAVALGEIDNMAYNGPTVGTADELRSKINDATNWNRDNSARQAIPTAFTVNSMTTSEGSTSTTDVASTSTTLGQSTTQLVPSTTSSTAATSTSVIDGTSTSEAAGIASTATKHASVVESTTMVAKATTSSKAMTPIAESTTSGEIATTLAEITTIVLETTSVVDSTTLGVTTSSEDTASIVETTISSETTTSEVMTSFETTTSIAETTISSETTTLEVTTFPEATTSTADTTISSETTTWEVTTSSEAAMSTAEIITSAEFSTTTEVVEILIGSMTFTSATLNKLQIETAAAKALAQEFGVNENQVTVIVVESRRLEGLGAVRRLAGNWDVTFSIVVPSSELAAVVNKASAIRSNPSSFNQAMKTHLEALGVRETDAAIVVINFEAMHSNADTTSSQSPVEASNSHCLLIRSSLWAIEGFVPLLLLMESL